MDTLILALWGDALSAAIVLVAVAAVAFVVVTLWLRRR